MFEIVTHRVEIILEFCLFLHLKELSTGLFLFKTTGCYSVSICSSNLLVVSLFWDFSRLIWLGPVFIFFFFKKIIILILKFQSYFASILDILTGHVLLNYFICIYLQMYIHYEMMNSYESSSFKNEDFCEVSWLPLLLTLIIFVKIPPVISK